MPSKIKQSVNTTRSFKKTNINSSKSKKQNPFVLYWNDPKNKVWKWVIYIFCIAAIIGTILWMIYGAEKSKQHQALRDQHKEHTEKHQ